MRTVLFTTRLLLYLVALSVPIFHPAVVVSYDAQSALAWFILIPLEMVIAYAGAPPRLRPRAYLLTAAIPIVAFGIYVGMDASPWPTVAAGTAAFALTAVLFTLGPRFRLLFAVEQFFLALIYVRLLAFSRASEEMAAAAQQASQLIFVLVVVCFLLHGVVIGLVLARPTTDDARKRPLKEGAVLTAGAVPLLLLTAFAIPPGFLDHSPIVNLLDRQAEPNREPLDADSDLQDDGGLGDAEGLDSAPGMREGTSALEDAFAGELDTSLHGVEAGDWDADGMHGQDSQRAVMIVRSDYSPIYAAEAYYADFDRKRGFQQPEEYALNELVHLRLAGTWHHPDTGKETSSARDPRDARIGRLLGSRSEEEGGDSQLRDTYQVDYYSTISDRVLQYRPWSVEPTVRDGRYHPFSYSYRSESRIGEGSPWRYREVPDPDEETLAELEEYLELELEEEHRAAFEEHSQELIGSPESQQKTINAIMESFRSFQYELGYDDTFATGHMARFVSETHTGDCVEFANTAAILGRMHGIPSRVVTGYLAARDLQTPSHMQGLAHLQQELPSLAEYDLSELFLVTTSHRHAWVQYYLPQYGWVDFEPTSYAMPPDPAGDPNQRQVVIPTINPQLERPDHAGFPWGRAARALAWMALLVAAGLYVLRYGYEGYLAIQASRNTPRADRAIYRLTLMQLAAAGSHLKPAGETPREYAERHPEFRVFAEEYTRAHYGRPQPTPEDVARLRDERRTIVRAARRQRILNYLRSIVSLRGLYYV